MNMRELFEMASLDVLGLLDESEREAFESAFRQASPKIQAQIRREQLRFSEIEKTLPEIKAPVGLKARVMAAVRDAIAAVRTEPIATIGGGRQFVLNSAPMWRAACIGFASASLVLSGFVYKVSQHNRTITDSLSSTALAEQLRRLSSDGANYQEMLAAPGLTFVDFSPSAPDAGAANHEPVGRLFFDPEHKEAILMCRHLPIESGEYTLVIRGADGKSDSERFLATPGGVNRPIDSIDLTTLGSIEILSPAREGAQPTMLLKWDNTV